MSDPTWATPDSQEETKQEQTQLSLYTKLSKIMQEVEYLNKDTTIKTKRGEYNVISESAVLKAVRPKLIEYGIVVIPRNMEVTRLGTVTTLTAWWAIIDSQTGEEITACSTGQGHDDYDKGAGMAQTYALKYLFLKMFQIKTGDDPDLVGNAEHEEKAAEKAAKKAVELSDEFTVGHMKVVCDRFNQAAHDAKVVPAEQYEKFKARLEQVYQDDEPTEAKKERFKNAFRMARDVLVNAGVELPSIE